MVAFRQRESINSTLAPMDVFFSAVVMIAVLLYIPMQGRFGVREKNGLFPNPT